MVHLFAALLFIVAAGGAGLLVAALLFDRAEAIMAALGVADVTVAPPVRRRAVRVRTVSRPVAARAELRHAA